MRRQLVATAVAALASMTPASADGYPSKQITFIVPFAAGGPLDSIARSIAEPMRADLGQPIIIENVAGAGGSVGVGRAAHAAPDGYTVSVGNWSTHVLNGAIYTTLHYDLLNDLAPVALLPSAPQLIVAKSSLPVTNFHELVTWLKSTKANVSTAGVGSASRVSGLLFQDMTKTQTRLCCLSQRRGRVAGPRCRSCGSDVRSGLQFPATNPRRSDQGLRRDQ